MLQKKVSFLVESTIKARGLSTSRAAREWGVHRNFLIDLCNGRVPRVRDGAKFAREDPRYRALALGMGVDQEEFLALAEAEQRTAYSAEHEMVEVGRGGIVIRITPSSMQLAPISMTFVFEGAEVTVNVRKK